MTTLSIEVHGDCTVIAERDPRQVYVHYEPVIVESKRYTAAQIAEAMRYSMERAKRQRI